MTLIRDAFCSFCGTAYAAPLSYPRSCASCKTQIWANPIPVSVILVPVEMGGDPPNPPAQPLESGGEPRAREARTGLLVIRRAIPPQIGKLALVGGFLEEHEPWAVGGAREVREETGVIVDEKSITPFWFTSTEPRPNRVLLFGISAPVDASAIGAYQPNHETSERGLVFGPEGLADVFAFPLHIEAARRFFASRSIEGAHDFTRI